MIKDIILLELNFKDNIIQESSIIMIIADAAVTMNNTVNVINNNCTEDISIANNSYI